MSRSDQDPAAQVAAELRARLRGMQGDELVELCAQLLTTYVVEGVVPLSRAGESTELAADSGGEESFAQLLKRLKAQKRDPVLEKFFIDGENISVSIDGQGIMPVTQYRRPTGPPPASGGVSVQLQPMPRRESVPGGSTSIYNRGLYDNEPAPQRRPAQPPQAARPAQQPAPAQPQSQPPANAPGAPGKKEPEQPKSDRFSLIELE